MWGDVGRCATFEGSSHAIEKGGHDGWGSELEEELPHGLGSVSGDLCELGEEEAWEGGGAPLLWDETDAQHATLIGAARAREQLVPEHCALARALPRNSTRQHALLLGLEYKQPVLPDCESAFRALARPVTHLGHVTCSREEGQRRWAEVER